MRYKHLGIRAQSLLRESLVRKRLLLPIGIGEGARVDPCVADKDPSARALFGHDLAHLVFGGIAAQHSLVDHESWGAVMFSLLARSRFAERIAVIFGSGIRSRIGFGSKPRSRASRESASGSGDPFRVIKAS